MYIKRQSKIMCQWIGKYTTFSTSFYHLKNSSHLHKIYTTKQNPVEIKQRHNSTSYAKKNCCSLYNSTSNANKRQL